MNAPQTIEVNPLRLTLQISHARLKANSGMSLTRNAGSVTSIREEYALPRTVRTWAQLLPELEAIKAQVDEQLEAASYPGAPGNDDPDEQHDEERDNAS